MRRANKIQFMRRPNVLNPIEAWNVHNIIFVYITLFINEHKCLRFICLFSVTVDNGSSQKTERIGNTWLIQSDKRGVLNYY